LTVKEVTMEQNPYRPPEAEIVEPIQYGQLAGRGERLLAVLLDTLIMLVIMLPIMFVTGYWKTVTRGHPPDFSTQLLYGSIGLVVFILVQSYPLNASGQTWGKRAMKIRIADMQGGKPAFSNLMLKRYLAIQVVGFVPWAGGIVAWVDALMIFRADRRCGHDFIAGTQVVKVD
jgi:uncharacterized RDD family membrane protein YckC